MKNNFLLVAFAALWGLASLAHAINPLAEPYSDFVGNSHNAQVVIAAPTTPGALNNYLSDLTVMTDAACTLKVTSNGVTIFQVSLQANEGYEKVWARGLKGTANQDLTITVSAGNYDINYSGVAR